MFLDGPVEGGELLWTQDSLSLLLQLLLGDLDEPIDVRTDLEEWTLVDEVSSR